MATTVTFLRAVVWVCYATESGGRDTNVGTKKPKCDTKRNHLITLCNWTCIQLGHRGSKKYLTPANTYVADIGRQWEVVVIGRDVEGAWWRSGEEEIMLRGRDNAEVTINPV